MRRGFTLLELLLSLFLTMLIVYFSYSFLAEAKNKASWGYEVDKKHIKKNMLYETLKDDLLYSGSVEISGGKEYSILKIKTKNSLHDIMSPFVVWVVLKDKKELVRMEAKDEFSLPIAQNNIYSMFLDEMGTFCNVFKVYKSSGGKDAMVYIKFVGEQPYIFEVPLKLTN